MNAFKRTFAEMVQSICNVVRRSPHVLADGIHSGNWASNEPTDLWIYGIHFTGGKWNRHRDKYIAMSNDGKLIVKFQPHDSQSRKTLTLAEETNLMYRLLQANCRSIPKIIHAGPATDGVTERNSREHLARTMGREISAGDWIIVQEWIPSTRTLPLADLVLSLLEQRGLGIFCGDLKSANLRYDSKRGICMVVDLDQAINVDVDPDETAEAFWLDATRQFQDRFGHPKLSNALPGYHPRDNKKIFLDGSLDLRRTTLFRQQKTTRIRGGGYHQMLSPLFNSKGARTLDNRIEILNRLPMDNYSRVLDVGANLGLAAHFFAQNGCRVTATDLDDSIVALGQMVANAQTLDIKFEVNRLGTDPLKGNWDLALLFSVLHHTPNVEASAASIRSSCRSALLEVRLQESGRAPVNGDWVDTSKWSFDTLPDLSNYLATLFAPCEEPEYLGPVDKARHMFLVNFS